MNSKKDIDMLIDPPAFCEGKEAWVRWRKGLEKDENLEKLAGIRDQYPDIA